jgi:replicative DNA helicase
VKPRNIPKEELPPHDVGQERAVLSSLLIDPAIAYDACQEAGASADWFYDLRCNTIWRVLHELLGKMAAQENGAGSIVGPDMLMLHQHLRQNDLMDEAGGEAWVLELFEAAHSAANLPDWLGTLKELWQRRKLLELAWKMKDQARTGETAKMIESGVIELGQISENAQACAEVNVREVAAQVIYEHEEYHRGKPQMKGISTGLESVDKLLLGLGQDKGNFVVLAGRPAAGKSAWMLQFALHAALDYVWFKPVLDGQGQAVMEGDKWKVTSGVGVPVAIFSLEMKTRTLMQRMLFQRAFTDLQRWRTGYGEGETIHELIRAGQPLIDRHNIWLDDTPRLTIEQVRARARRMSRQYGIKVFILDYIQLLRTLSVRSGDRVAELTWISSELAALGKELDALWVVLAQMNRDIEKEGDRKPRLADLKDCGAIEQDADLVGFLYKPQLAEKERAEYHDMMEADFGDDWSKKPERVNLFIAKNRNGFDGNCKLLFQRSCTRFYDWEWWKRNRNQVAAAARERNQTGMNLTAENA